MTKYIHVSLSPKFDGRMREDDLERELTSSNLFHLMPSVEDGARKAFFREIKEIQEEYGVAFKIEKDTNHEILFSIHKGRANWGSYMVIYHTAKYAKPVWYGSKSRVLDRTAGSPHFIDITKRLNETLANHYLNSYTFHQRTRAWLQKISELRLPRSTTLGGKTNNTEDYLVNLIYLNNIKSLARIYSLFGMTLTHQEVEV